MRIESCVAPQTELRMIPLADIPIPSAGPVDTAIIDDLVAASRILAQHGVLDAWGHVSIRHPANPERYLLSRARAPALVLAPRF